MGLMQTLLLSCRKATLLLERRTMAPLNAQERMQLWMHTRICSGCRAFAAQNAMIDKLAEARDAKPDIDPDPLKERILKDLSGTSGV
jgi:hypothetical protein